MNGPPLWVNRFAFWFRLGIGLMAIASVLLSSCSSRRDLQAIAWKPASSLQASDNLTEIVRTHSALATSEIEGVVSGMKGGQFSIDDRRQIHLYDYDNPALCGTMGCLYTGYLFGDGQSIEVFNAYLDPFLPPGTPLFQLGRDAVNDLPCLRVNQFADNLVESRLCFDGDRYRVFDSWVKV